MKKTYMLIAAFAIAVTLAFVSPSFAQTTNAEMPSKSDTVVKKEKKDKKGKKAHGKHKKAVTKEIK